MSGSPQFPSFEAISGPVRDGAGKESCWSRYLLQSSCTWLTKSYLGGSGGTRRGLLVGASFGKLKKENPEFAVRPCAFFLENVFSSIAWTNWAWRWFEALWQKCCQLFHLSRQFVPAQGRTKEKRVSCKWPK